MIPVSLYLELTLVITVHWASGEVTLDNETHLPIFTPTMSGFLDWGISAYAAAGQNLPSSSLASNKSGVHNDRWISYGKHSTILPRIHIIFYSPSIPDSH